MISNINFTGSRYLIARDQNNNVIPCMSHEIRENPDRPDDPDVVICTSKDPKTGKIIEKTLPLSHVQKMHKTFSNKILATLVPIIFWGSFPAGDIAGRYDAVDYSEPLGIEYKINTVDEALEVVDFSDEIKGNVQTMGYQGQRFIKSLAENKDSLMKDLKLTNKEYDDLADLAVKISGNETKYGENLKYKGIMVGESYYLGALGASTAREKKNPNVANAEVLSRGMTQYKIALASDEEKELFDKYGVSYNNLTTNIQYPEKSAIATMIHLNTLRQGYDEYIAEMENITPDINDPEVQASIKNAKSIIFDNDKRGVAIEALRQVNDSEKETELLTKAGLEKKDLDDLRLLARGVRISEKAYTGAGWNGKYIKPYVDYKSDISCSNLLRAAAGVGYIAELSNDAEIVI